MTLARVVQSYTFVVHIMQSAPCNPLIHLLNLKPFMVSCLFTATSTNLPSSYFTTIPSSFNSFLILSVDGTTSLNKSASVSSLRIR